MMSIKQIIFLLFLICLFSITISAQGKFNLKWNTRTIALVPASPVEGDTVEFKSFLVAYGNSVENVAVRVLLDDIKIYETKVLRMNVGVQVPITTMWTATVGPHEVKFIADPDNLMVENDETDNVQTRAFTVPAKISLIKPIPQLKPGSIVIPKRPDIIIDQLWTTTLHVYPRESIIKLWIRVKNIGTGSSANGVLRIIIDGIESIYFPEVQNFLKTQDKTMYGMSPGNTYTYGLEVRLKSGKYQLKAIADVTNVIKEFREDNNESSIEFWIVRRVD